MGRPQRWLTRLLVGAIVLMVAGLVPSPRFSGGGSAQAASAEPIRVAITVPFAPWDYHDKSGKLTGFEVEMLREIGRRLDRDVQFVEVQWDGIFAGLTANKYDIIASNVGITCDRQKLYDFSVPYYNDGVSISARTSDKRVQRVQDLKGMVVGVGGAGTTSHLWLLKNRFKYGIKEIKVYEGEGGAVWLDLQAGRIDAVAETTPTALYYVRDKPWLQVRLPDLTSFYGALVFRKGDPLVGPVNNAIDAMKRDDTMARIHREQFGIAAPPGGAVVKVIPPVVLDCK